MQNKFVMLMIVSIVGYSAHALAQETLELNDADLTSNSTEITPNIAGKQPVDFPARSSMGSLELAPLPGINQTPVEGPMPFTPSVSSKDLPSEQLLGRLNPEVFQEMAEMERDRVFLDLLVKKEKAKKDLEDAKATYRKSRLEEIAAREELIRSRIEWWQEQERIRLDLEKQRAEVENSRNELEDAKTVQDIADEPIIEEPENLPEEPVLDDVPPMGQVAAYVLLSIQGSSGNLVAKVRNTDTGKISKVRVGDTLTTGDVITSITSTQVVMAFQGSEYVLTFDEGL